jgi:hypothetical protein
MLARKVGINIVLILRDLKNNYGKALQPRKDSSMKNILQKIFGNTNYLCKDIKSKMTQLHLLMVKEADSGQRLTLKKF